MGKKKRFNIHYLFIVLYGLAIISCMCGMGNLYGSKTDWLGQHVVFPDLFRQAFYESKQLIPNFLFQIGGGQNAFMFTYYGFLSPVILVSYLLPFVDMTVYVISASIILYLMAGILAYIFLKKHFGAIHALAGSFIFMSLPPVNYHFHHHIMFVWYLPFLILSLMGLDRYFDKRKKGLFIGSALGIILTNYYFSVGSLVCLFIYAIYRLLQEKDLNYKSCLKKFCNIVGVFMLPVMLSAFILLPTAYALFSNSRSFAVTEGMESLLLPNLSDSFFSNFGMGITGLMFVAIMGNLTCRNLKKCDLFLNGFLIVIIVCPIVSYILNGMLYVRGKVLIPFAILSVYAFCQFIKNLQEQKIQYLYATIGVGIFCALYFSISKVNQWICISIFVGMLVALLLRKRPQILYSCAIIVLLTASLVINRENEEYVSTAYYEGLYQDEIENLMQYAEDDWYRTNVSHLEKHLGNRVFGNKFYGTSVYSSTSNSKYQEFYETYMGNNERYRNCFITSGAQNELFYTFMGTRYIIAEKDPGFLYEKVAEETNLSLYKNTSAYPLVYKSRQCINEAYFDKLEFPKTAELLMTHTVVKEGKGSVPKSVLEKWYVEDNYQFVQEKDAVYEIQLDDTYQNKILYLSFDIVNKGDYHNKKDISISMNGVKNKLTADTWQYYNGNTKFEYVVPMENTSVLTINITKGRYDIKNLQMYTSPVIFENYQEAENLKINSFSDTISCEIEASEGDYLVTSIPFDTGFTIEVNGKPREVELVNKAFVGCQLEEGMNQVMIKYTAPFYLPGVVISVVGVLILLYLTLKSRLDAILKKYKEVAMYLLFGVLTTVVSLLTYFLCTTFVLDAGEALQLQTANVISWLASVTFAYVTNKCFVFHSHNTIAKEIGKFYLSRAGTLVIDMGLMYLLVTIVNMEDMIAKTIVQVIVIIANYILGKFLVFKEESTNENISSSTLL